MAKFDFDLEMGGDLDREAAKAAKAADRLADTLAFLDKRQDKAAQSALRLAKAEARTAEESYKLARAQRVAGRSMDPRDTVKAAKARARLAESQRAVNKAHMAQANIVKPGGRGSLISMMKKGLVPAIGAVAAAYGVARVAAFTFRKAADITGAVVEMAMFAESTKLAFSNLRGGKRLGEEAFASTLNLSQKLGEEVDVTAGRMKKLLAQQFSLKESEGLIKMVADLKTIGVEGEKADRVLLALTQIRAKGKFQAEEALQLAEAGISLQLVYGELGNILGKNREELEDMQRAGKVAPDAALEAVRRAALKKVGKKEAGKAGEEYADQMLRGMTNRISASKKTWILELSEFLDTKPLGAFAKDVSKVLADKDIRKGFESGIGRIGDFVDRLNPSVIKSFASGIEIAGSAFDKLVLVTGEFAEGFFGELGPALAKFSGTKFTNVDSLGKLANIAGTEVGKLATDFLEFGNKAIPILDKTVSLLEKVTNLFGAGEEKAKGEGGSIAMGLAEGMFFGVQGQGIGLAALAGRKLGEAMSGGAKNALEQHSPSRVGMDIGANFDKSIAIGAESQGFAMKAAGDIGAGMGRAFSMPASRPKFAGSPAHKALASAGNTVNFSQRNNYSISEAERGRQTATAVASAGFDFTMAAKDKFAVGLGIGT